MSIMTVGRPINGNKRKPKTPIPADLAPRCCASESSVHAYEDAKSCQVLLILTDDRCY